MHCNAFQYHVSYIMLGVFLWDRCWYPESPSLCFSHVVQASLCTAVCCVKSLSVLWQQWQSGTESCCCPTGGCALRTLRVLHSTKNCCTTSKGTRICARKGYLGQQNWLLLSFQECPLRTLGELMYHYRIGLHIFVLHVYLEEHSIMTNCTL